MITEVVIITHTYMCVYTDTDADTHHLLINHFYTTYKV